MPEAPVHRKGIVVLDYDPSWPAAFAAIRERLGEILNGLAIDICHVDSTAMPGLCAKPKIDVDVVLASAQIIPEGTERLKTAGYAGHGNKYNDGMWTFTMGRGSFGERVYLCAPHTATHENRWRFRDYLRAHPEAAEEYGRLKRRLASEARDDWDFYTGGKGPFVAEIVARAQREVLMAPEMTTPTAAM